MYAHYSGNGLRLYWYCAGTIQGFSTVAVHSPCYTRAYPELTSYGLRIGPTCFSISSTVILSDIPSPSMLPASVCIRTALLLVYYWYGSGMGLVWILYKGIPVPGDIYRSIVQVQER